MIKIHNIYTSLEIPSVSQSELSGSAPITIEFNENHYTDPNSRAIFNILITCLGRYLNSIDHICLVSFCIPDTVLEKYNIESTILINTTIMTKFMSEVFENSFYFKIDPWHLETVKKLGCFAVNFSIYERKTGCEI